MSVPAGSTSGSGGELLPVLLAAAAAGGGESLSDAAGIPCVDVEPGAWRVVLLAGREAGAHLDWLTGVDAGGGVIEVVAMLIRPGGDVPTNPGGEAVADLEADRFAHPGAEVLVRTSVPRDGELPSVADALPAAAWHERETAEMLGITFAGGDPRHLLLPEGFEGHPLRRDFPLTPRLTTPWPGAAEAGRRARTPGVNPEWGSAT